MLRSAAQQGCWCTAAAIAAPMHVPYLSSPLRPDKELRHLSTDALQHSTTPCTAGSKVACRCGGTCTLHERAEPYLVGVRARPGQQQQQAAGVALYRPAPLLREALAGCGESG